MYEKIISRAKELGISAEIFSIKLKEYTITKDKYYIPIKIEENGYGIRVIDSNNRMGYLYSKKLDDKILEDALKVAKLGDSDKANVLPSRKPIRKLNGLYKLENAEDKVKEVVSEMNDLEDKLNLTSISVSIIDYEISIINTEGVDVGEKRGLFLIQILANSDNNSPEIYEYNLSRNHDIKLDKLKETIIEKAKILRKREKVDVKGYDVTFTQKALDSIFSSLFPSLFSAKSYFKRITPFKLGELINEDLEIIDNPLDSALPFSRSFDDEGNPSKINNVIENGIVKTFLSNTYWSIKASIDNTSSASRTIDSLIPSYFTLPLIDFSNIVVKHRNSEHEVEDNSVVIDQVQGIDTADLSSGNFSLVASVSWINKKEEKKGLREVIVTGNLKELLKNVVSSSKDIEAYGKVVSGKLRVRGLSLV
ncbi:TldD/PmbA family protein [Sulfolobus tengchongensis]|uniref:TldD/PmbA family protein n=1 Tax=Sulfolobus tengchongensis TaxID=207809 RepID=A0AAX4L097_9CREN